MVTSSLDLISPSSFTYTSTSPRLETGLPPKSSTYSKRRFHAGNSRDTISIVSLFIAAYMAQADESAEDLDSIVQQENMIFASGAEPRQVAQLGETTDPSRRV